jgi:hypothetical protein
MIAKRLIFSFIVLSIAVLGAAYSDFGISEYKLQTNAELRELESKTYCRSYNDKFDRGLVTCQNFRGMDKDIFIWGDSHAKHLVAGFSEVFPNYNVFVLYMTGCVPQSGFQGYLRDYKDDRTIECVRRNKNALQFFFERQPTNIIITSAKRDKPERMASIAKDLAILLGQHGHNAVVLGDFIRPGVALIGCQDCEPDKRQVLQELRYNKRFHKEFPEAVMPDLFQCPGGECIFYAGGKPIHRDNHHLSIFGATEMVGRMKDHIPLN